METENQKRGDIAGISRCKIEENEKENFGVKK